MCSQKVLAESYDDSWKLESQLRLKTLQERAEDYHLRIKLQQEQEENRKKYAHESKEERRLFYLLSEKNRLEQIQNRPVNDEVQREKLFIEHENELAEYRRHQDLIRVNYIKYRQYIQGATPQRDLIPENEEIGLEN